MDSLLDPLLSANFTLWACITTLILFIGFISFKLASSSGEGVDESQERTLRMWGYFFIILAFSNILILCWRFAFFETIVGNILERIANALFYFACFIKVMDIEKSIIESGWYKRRYFSVLIFITIVINLGVSPDFLKTISPWQIAFLVFVTMGYSVFPIVYFYVSRKSTGRVRNNALKVSAGAIFLALGYLFRPENLVAYRGDPFINTIIDIFYISAPIAIVIGTLLIYDSFRKIG